MDAQTTFPLLGLLSEPRIIHKYIEYFFTEWGWLWWRHTQSTGPGSRDLLLTNKTVIIFRLRATLGPSAWSRPTRLGSTGWPWRTSRGSRRRDMARTSWWGNCEQLQRSARTFCCYLFCKFWSQVTKHDTHIHNDSCSGSDRIQNECFFVFRLAASVLVEEKSIFMIKVMYEVQVKVKTSHLQRDLRVRVPFLMAPYSPHSSSEN